MISWNESATSLHANNLVFTSSHSAQYLAHGAQGRAMAAQKARTAGMPRTPACATGKRSNLTPRDVFPTDVWRLAAANSKKAHYAAFPAELVKPIIEACTVPGDLVLDPFAGTGTTCQVAAQMGRRWLGIELNPEYAAMANSALAKEACNKTETFLDNGHSKCPTAW
jgi:hypothetical protein